MRLLEDILVIDFSQFLSGPSASLRLADMGARVVKIEKPSTGDICRYLYVSDTRIEGESTIFHAINRNKESYTADLKEEHDVCKIKELIKQADVVIHNFRPDVMKRLGLDYDVVKTINPSIIYGEISGYGNGGPWKDLPGQDLLLQSVSGLTWLSNNDNTNPTPMGVAVVDIVAGTHLAQGILAALFQRTQTNKGALVQVSMLESILDFQFEVLTCFYNDGEQLPVRSAVNNANAYIAAPYGIYKTLDGFLALSMTNIVELGSIIGCKDLLSYTMPSEWYNQRDEIKSIIADCLAEKTTDEWLAVLRPEDIWCAKVLDYEMLMQEEGYQCLQMELEVQTSAGLTVKTTRCPFRVDGQLLTSKKGAPVLGEDTHRINREFGIL
jgi:CoA:oxalate CoA-transferase